MHAICSCLPTNESSFKIKTPASPKDEADVRGTTFVERRRSKRAAFLSEILNANHAGNANKSSSRFRLPGDLPRSSANYLSAQGQSLYCGKFRVLLKFTAVHKSIQLWSV